MKISHFQYHAINLVGGFQFWSDPSLSETERAIQIVLARPTLLDLLSLSTKFGVEKLIKENDELFRSGEILASTHRWNATRLRSIERGYADA